jgi:hypothetical protein
MERISPSLFLPIIMLLMMMMKSLKKEMVVEGLIVLERKILS